MKKIILTMATVFALIGCTKEEEVKPLPVAPKQTPHDFKQDGISKVVRMVLSGHNNITTDYYSNGTPIIETATHFESRLDSGDVMYLEARVPQHITTLTFDIYIDGVFNYSVTNAINPFYLSFHYENYIH